MQTNLGVGLEEQLPIVNSMLRRSGGMLPMKILRISVSETAYGGIWRLYNTSHHLVFVHQLRSGYTIVQ